MRFDMNNIHTIFESAKSKNCVPSEHADKSGSKIDATLGDSDLIGLFDNICPICGDVFASMKDAAADPKNLKLTMVKTEDLGEATKIYIEAVEFATFCEAADLNIGEAAEEILDTCKGMVPGSNDSELHVVFPSEALNKGELGSTRFGRDIRNDWAMQLLTGCRRYGIHVNSGVEDGEPVTESAYKKAMNEAASKKPLGYEACIKRDKALIEREVNAASKEVYKTFKDNVSSHYEKYMDEFYKKNKTAPKFDGLTHETDLYAIELNTNAYIDICLFYQDRVCKLLNKSEKLKALGYKFETEDYHGIFIRNAAAQAINEGVVQKIIDKIKNRNNHSDELVFTSSQYAAYRKAIIEISKKYEHVGKYLYVLTYKDLCRVGCDGETSDGFEYWVAAFDTDDRRDDKEIRSYEKGDGNQDFVDNLDKERNDFVKELNSANINGAKFDSDFNGHRFDLTMTVPKSTHVKESSESIEEGFGRHGFRDVKPLRDDKDGNKKREYSNDGLELPSAPDEGLPELDLPSDPDTDLPKLDLPKAVDEAYSESKTLKGVKIYIDGPSKKIDVAIKLCNKNWSRIVNEAAEDWFNRIDRCDDDGSLKKTYPTVSAVKSHMTLDTVRYSSEEKRNNPICGSMDLSFDVDPEIDPNHFYTLYVDFDKDQSIRFDSIFDG